MEKHQNIKEDLCHNFQGALKMAGQSENKKNSGIRAKTVTFVLNSHKYDNCNYGNIQNEKRHYLITVLNAYSI